MNAGIWRAATITAIVVAMPDVSPFLWFVPSIVAMAITGLGRVVVESELRDYVRVRYPEVFERETSTEEFGVDSKRGSSFMTVPVADDSELHRLRERVTNWLIAMMLAMLSLGVVMVTLFLTGD